MLDLVTLAAVGGAAVVTGQMLVIGLVKLVRETAARRRETARAVLEARLLDYVVGPRPEPPQWIGALGRRRRLLLEQIALEHLQRVRGGAKHRLAAALREAGAMDRYLHGLRHRRPQRRALAAERLAIAGLPPDAARQVVHLGDDTVEVRLRAAEALSPLGVLPTPAALVETLNEPNRWNAIRMADVFAGHPEEFVRRLATAMPELEMAARLNAFDILADLRPLGASAMLRDALRDAEPQVRARACSALGTIADPAAGPDLAQAFVEAGGSDDWVVRAMAAKALGRIRYLPAAALLTDALRDREWWVRVNAATALLAMGRHGIEACLKVLDDHDPYARHQAVFMLEEAGFVDDEIERLTQGSADEQAAAAAVLARLVASGRLARLRDLCRNHPSPEVRRRIESLLESTPA